MYNLNDSQIDYILSDIRRRGVEMEDLQSNLLDHICCIIEQNLEEKGDFEDFYKKTIPRFFKHELWEIEEETLLLLIFKHYYTMKKIMFSSGFVSAFMIFAGSFFKIMHWPGASPLLILGGVLFSLLFLPLMFTLKLKEKTERRDKTVLLLGLAASIVLLFAAMFKVMHWPGASMLSLGGIFLLLFIFLPVYLSTGLRNPATRVNVIVTSILIIAGSGFLLVLPSRGSSLTLSKATVNYMKNEETVVEKLRSEVGTNSGNKEASDSYAAFMASADKLKNAIAKIISGKDYDAYLNNSDDINPGAFTSEILNSLPEKENYISALVDLETKMNASLYTYDNSLGFSSPLRSAQLDFAFQNQGHVKDLMSFISNTEIQACLLFVKK